MVPDENSNFGACNHNFLFKKMQILASLFSRGVIRGYRWKNNALLYSPLWFKAYPALRLKAESQPQPQRQLKYKSEPQPQHKYSSKFSFHPSPLEPNSVTLKKKEKIQKFTNMILYPQKILVFRLLEEKIIFVNVARFSVNDLIYQTQYY